MPNDINKIQSIPKLIINEPFNEPQKHWNYIEETNEWELVHKRRKSYYTLTDSNKNGQGEKISLDTVNIIREQVSKWRENGYAGVTGITKKLLEYWTDKNQRVKPFFFCQIEAIETLIWWLEAPAVEKTGIELEGDGSDFTRICTKMATGTGKTVVMSMLIAYFILNKATYPKDKRFVKNILIIAPNLIVKQRLNVLKINQENNYYQEYSIVPPSLIEKMNQGAVVIHNWHTLAWENQEKLDKKLGVDKRGVKSDLAYAKEILEGRKGSFIVINDEAHHAWRINSADKEKRGSKEDIQEATVWIGGLDKIHKAQEIRYCFDFSATPFYPSGKKNTVEKLFNWIISDFGLTEAIESGLVKTPQAPTYDNLGKTQDYYSQLHHIYKNEDVQKDLTDTKAEENKELPTIIKDTYRVIGEHYKKTYDTWKGNNSPIPPVLLSVVNTKITADRVDYSFTKQDLTDVEELLVKESRLKIYSDLSIGVDKDKEKLKEVAYSVGKEGKIGQNITNIISVAMLSEGWDANNITHIVGLRAFSSQLLCEQIVGRGLRRQSYELNEEGLLSAEYVQVVGIPFWFLPQENQVSSPNKPTHLVTLLEERENFAINFPNIERIEESYKLKLQWKEKMRPLKLNIEDTLISADFNSALSGKPFKDIEKIDLTHLLEDTKIRPQKLVFTLARKIFKDKKQILDIQGKDEFIFSNIVSICKDLVYSHNIEVINHQLYTSIEKNKLQRLMIYCNLDTVKSYILQNLDTVEMAKEMIHYGYPRILSTYQFQSFRTSKPLEYTVKTHANACIYDSMLEQRTVKILERHPKILSWIRNDHLGFKIHYEFKNKSRAYYPDFLVRLENDIYLILEPKGRRFAEQDSKDVFTRHWVNTINNAKEYGKWYYYILDEKNIEEFSDFLEEL